MTEGAQGETGTADLDKSDTLDADATAAASLPTPPERAIYFIITILFLLLERSIPDRADTQTSIE